MQFVQALLFESPIWTGVLSFVCFAIVLLARPRMSEKARNRAMPAVLLMTLALFVMQWAVETDRERILNALDRFVNGIEHEDAVQWSSVIADRYQAEGMDHDAMIEFLTDAFSVCDIYDARFRRRDVSVDGDQAAMTLSAMATVRVRGGVGAFHTGRWHLDWLRESDGWKISAIKPEIVDTIPFDTLSDLRGRLPR